MELIKDKKQFNDWTWKGLTEGKLLAIQWAIEEHMQGHPTDAVANDIRIFLERNLPNPKTSA